MNNITGRKSNYLTKWANYHQRELAFDRLSATLREAIGMLRKVDTQIYGTTRNGSDSVSYCPICRRYGTNDNCIVSVDHADDCTEGQREKFLANFDKAE